MIRQIDIDVDYEQLLRTVHELNIINMLHEKPQLAVQHRIETKPDQQLYEGCNSLIYDWDNYDPDLHTELLKRENVLLETDFNVTCDLFKNTYVETVIDSLNNKFGVFRGRFMMMKYKTCLSTHTDDTNRIHIPIITNKYCYMVIEDTVYKLQSNATYLANTTLEHTAVNASRNNRIHLVFCTGTEY